jgi:hypothetical protein
MALRSFARPPAPAQPPLASPFVSAAMSLALAAALAVLVLGACGRKTEVKPPQLVAPRPVTEISLTTLADGVAIRWTRPTEYVDGTTMEDLGGFAIERSRNNQPFTELTRVPVTDRGRFQKAKRFEYVDQAVMEGTTYHYRVVAFTTDGYYSAPSGAATITWEPAQPSPSPVRTPVKGP